MMDQHIVTVKLNNYLICLDGMQPTYDSPPLTDINSPTNSNEGVANFLKNTENWRHRRIPE